MSKALTPQQIFAIEFPNGGKNFMTPRVLKMCKAGRNRAVELSCGEGMSLARMGGLRMVQGNGRTIYGVSVVDYDPDTRTTSRPEGVSRMFDSYREAVAYIDSLKRGS